MVVTETKIRVRYADTDQMKMMYYGKFFEYFEQGRSDLLRYIGMPYPEIERIGYFLPVVEAHAKYLRSARYDDLLVVKTMLDELPQVRVRITYEVFNEETHDLLAEGYTVHSFVSASTGKPARAPESFIEILQKALARNSSFQPAD
jgi:acyl-CoA thioester hydrolase